MLPFANRTLFIPEVVQTSAMDCGPAALKSLLEGFGVPVSYGRLREACQTDVDGTSIDTLEEIACQLGLDAEQIIVPVDHILLRESAALPAIVVVRLPIGFTHFVVVWRTQAGLVQVMDPGTGRRWPSAEQFVRDVYTHAMLVPAAAWRESAASEQFLQPLAVRMRRLGAGSIADRLIAAAISDAGWRPIAALDAATRLTTSLVRSGGLPRGRDASRLLATLFEQARDAPTPSEGEALVPGGYWSARAAKPSDEGEEQVQLVGAVLIRVRGKRTAAAASPPEGADEAARTPLSPELVAALAEPPTSPGRELIRALRQDGLFTPATLIAGFGLAALGSVLEAVLLRSLFDIGRQLDVVDKRVSAFAAYLLFLAVLVLLEVPLSSSILRIGRRLEGRLRLAFLRKIPRLGDRYFQSRPISDMAERSHSIQSLRMLPGLGGQLVRATFALLATAIGIAWLDRPSAPIAACVALLAFAIPIALQRPLEERDLRVRSHNGALSRYYLDALLGLVPVRAHGAEPALRREHESLLVEWAEASRTRDRLAIVIEAVQSLFSLGLAGWLFLSYYARVGEPGGALLLLYWALNLPAHGRELAVAVRQYPAHRNTALRLLEPLGALEEGGNADATSSVPERPANDRTPGGIALRFEGVSVRAGGHEILGDVDLTVEAGSQLAIVGPSGAGKSSLVGVLLGWHRAASGRILVDGVPLDGSRLDALRAETAWVDPAVQIWNRSLLDNLVYGASEEASVRVGQVIEEADLRGVLETLPDGLATTLGEGGGLVSGGEGQRVRLGRAVLRTTTRLVILDEPFRGLDREKRRKLLARARHWWPKATLLCITHDVGETRDFERVVIVDGGRIVEDGRPSELAALPDSRYAALLEAEDDVRSGLWANARWRRLHLANGVVREDRASSPEAPPHE